MEHGPTDTPTRSATAEPPASSHQSPPTALPSVGKRKPRMSLLGSMAEALSAMFLNVGPAAECPEPRNTAMGGHIDGEALAMGTAKTHEERLAAEEGAGGSGDGVEGAAVKGKGLQAGVGTWGSEMEERAAEAARAIQERKRAKDELVELAKEHEFLQAETERLRLQFVKMIKQAQREAGDWRDPLWLNANGVLQQFDSTRAEEVRVGAKVKRARKYLDRSEKEAEKLIGELGRVMSGALESVAGVGGPLVGVQVEDVKVEPKSEEVAREVETKSEEVATEVARD